MPSSSGLREGRALRRSPRCRTRRPHRPCRRVSRAKTAAASGLRNWLPVQTKTTSKVSSGTRDSVTRVDEMLKTAPRRAARRAGGARRGGRAGVAGGPARLPRRSGGAALRSLQPRGGGRAVFEHEARVRALVGVAGRCARRAVLDAGHRLAARTAGRADRRAGRGGDRRGGGDRCARAAAPAVRVARAGPSRCCGGCGCSAGPDSPSDCSARAACWRTRGFREATTHGDFHRERAAGATAPRGWSTGSSAAGRRPARPDALLGDARPTRHERAQLDAGALELAGDELELARLRYAVAAVTARRQARPPAGAPPRSSAGARRCSPPGRAPGAA